MFWQQPSVRFYCHEPFEVTYYGGSGLDEVAAQLASPLDLASLEPGGAAADRALVIKEMPYQVGDHFPLLAAMTSKPLVFLMRDPRLSISSRMARKEQVGDSPIFPKIESGWELWRSQIEWCRGREIPHLLVDASDFRSHPEAIFAVLFERLGLPFAPEMLRWRPCPQVDLDNLGGRHRHLYRKVLRSTGITPEEAPIPSLDTFPADGGWRQHVARCLAIYEEMAASRERIQGRRAAADPVVAR